MLSDKLELNSVRALGRLELTSWEHIPGWAEIQTPLGKPVKAWLGCGGGRGCLSALVGTSAYGSDPGTSRRPGCVTEKLGLVERMEAQQSHFTGKSWFWASS